MNANSTDSKSLDNILLEVINELKRRKNFKLGVLNGRGDVAAFPGYDKKKIEDFSDIFHSMLNSDNFTELGNIFLSTLYLKPKEGLLEYIESKSRAEGYYHIFLVPDEKKEFCSEYDGRFYVYGGEKKRVALEEFVDVVLRLALEDYKGEEDPVEMIANKIRRHYGLNLDENVIKLAKPFYWYLAVDLPVDKRLIKKNENEWIISKVEDKVTEELKSGILNKYGTPKKIHSEVYDSFIGAMMKKAFNER